MRYAVFFGGRAFPGAVVLAGFLASTAFGQTLTVIEQDYRRIKVTDDNVWAGLEIRDASGQPITGLDLAAVTVHESIVDAATGAQLTTPATIDLAEQAANVWKEAGLWEKTVGDTKLDIVFLVDGTATMDGHMAGIIAELHEFLDALVANRVDFRISTGDFREVPTGLRITPFYGPVEIERAREAIDDIDNTGGESWDPTTSYDAVMNTLWGGFREDAYKMAVVITDIVPQTVYGTFWYPGGCTAATLSGMEYFLKKHDIHVFFSHDADTGAGTDYEWYCNPDINPRAGSNESGLEALAGKTDALGRPLATDITWPFQAEHLMSGIAGRVDPTWIFSAPLPITESTYYLSWDPNLYWWDDIEMQPGEPEELLYRADIAVTIPGRKTTLTTWCTYPVEKTITDVYINVTDEHGNPQDDCWGYLEPLMGGRPMEYFYQQSPTGGVIHIERVPVGHYLLTLKDGGVHGYTYQDLRGITRMTLTVPPEGLTVDATLCTIDKEADLARVRGLLQDLADWRSPGDPFQDFVDDANAWLDALEADGVTWDELTQVKRFMVALSGYASITEFAQLQTEGAIDDFHQILMDFIAILEETEGLHESVEADWADALIEFLATIVDVLITHGDFTVKREALEAALDELIAYAQDEMITELKAEVVEQIPAGPYKPLITAMMYTCLDSDFEDWTPVMEAAQDLALHLAKQELIELLAENFVDAIFDDLELETPMEEAVEGLVKNILEAITSENGFDNFDSALEQFANDIGQYVLQEGVNHRADVVAAVESLFEKVEAELPPGRVRDFLVGMAKELALEAIPTVEGDTLKYDINSDAVVKILVRHALYNVVLKDYYAKDVRKGLYQTLYRAQAYVPEGEYRSDVESDMYWDFHPFRGERVGPLQDVAWNALSTQNDIDNWATGLESLASLLEAVYVPLVYLASFYPPLQDTAEAVDDFIAVLDSLQIATRAIEFGLKLDCLHTMANEAQPFYETIFPAPAESVFRMGVTPVEHDYGETKASWGAMLCPVTVWNAGNETLNIGGMTLSDSTNFSFAGITKSLTPTIAPGHSHTVYVKFDPTSTGEFETTLTVHCAMTDPAQKSITLRGVGTYLDTGIAGDSNSDTLVNAVDVQLVINAALGMFTHAHTDLNDDNQNNAVDVQLIINAVLGLW